MPTQFKQLDTDTPGTATLWVSGPQMTALVAVPEVVEMAIMLKTPIGEVYLHPSEVSDDRAWTLDPHYFQPVSARAEGNSLGLVVDSTVTERLRAHLPHTLLLRTLLGGAAIDRVIGPSHLRKPTRAPTGVPTPPPAAIVAGAKTDAVITTAAAGSHATASAATSAAPSGTVAAGSGNTAKDAATTSASTGPTPDGASAPPATGAGVGTTATPRTAAPPRATPVDTPPAPPPGKPITWWAVLLLIVMAFGWGAWAVLHDDSRSKGTPQEQAPASAPVSGADPLLEATRAFLRTYPEADAAFAKGEELSKAGTQLESQLLLYRYAAQHGSVPAAKHMGWFYDPVTWTDKASPFAAPDVLQASTWYKQAADAGDAEAQYRYAILLKNGGSEEANAPEQSVHYLDLSAKQGHPKASEELARVNGKP